MPPVFRLGPPKWVCLAKRHGGFIVLHYRYFVAVGKRAPSRPKRVYFTAEFMSIYGDRARVLRPLLACISLLNKVPLMLPRCCWASCCVPCPRNGVASVWLSQPRTEATYLPGREGEIAPGDV